MAKNTNKPQKNIEKKSLPLFLKSRIWMNRIILGLALAGGSMAVWYGSQPNTSEYEMSDEEKKENDRVNNDSTITPTHYVKIGPSEMDLNIIPEGTDPNAKVVRLALPGEDRYGEPQNPPFREPEAKRFWKQYKDCMRRYRVMMIVNSSWRSGGEQEILMEKLPGLASKPGTSRHGIDAVDISRISANEKNPRPLTVDLEGNVIYLEDVVEDKNNGKARFAEVIKKIFSKEIAANPRLAERIVESWTKTVTEDFNNNVWGAQDVCMESFQEYGSTISHCGAVSNSTNPKALRETWHGQPSKRMANCRRWDETYNANIKMYRKHPPISEDQWMKKVGNFMKNSKLWYEEQKGKLGDKLDQLKEWNEKSKRKK